MAKELSTGAKIVIWVGVLTTVGVSGWAFHKFVIKPWKAKRAASKIDDSDIIMPADSSITPKDTSTPTDVNVKSFEDVKKALGSNAKVFADYVTLTSTPEAFGLGGNLGGRVMVKFQKDTGYRLYLIPTGSSETSYFTEVYIGMAGKV